MGKAKKSKTGKIVKPARSPGTRSPFPGRPNGRTGWVPAKPGLDPHDPVAGRRLPRLARDPALEGRAARLHEQGRGRRARHGDADRALLRHGPLQAGAASRSSARSPSRRAPTRSCRSGRAAASSGSTAGTTPRCSARPSRTAASGSRTRPRTSSATGSRSARRSASSPLACETRRVTTSRYRLDASNAYGTGAPPASVRGASRRGAQALVPPKPRSWNLKPGVNGRHEPPVAAATPTPSKRKANVLHTA